MHHPDRLVGACDSVIRDLLAEGHTAATPEEVRRRLTRKGVASAQALAAGIARGKLLPLGSLLRAPGAARLETALQQHLQRLRTANGPYDVMADLRALNLVHQAEAATRLTLTDEQRLAVSVLLREHVALLQGGAGVGKTTAVKVLVAAWRDAGGRVEMAALSGKAALRLSMAVGEGAMTIARLIAGLDRRAELVAAGKLVETSEGDRWAKDLTHTSARGPSEDEIGCADFPPKLDASTMLILDEASMIDLGSLYDLVRRMPDGSRLVQIGDRFQLPPIGLGQCFHDLVEAGKGVAELTRVLRQADDNPLLNVASAIREGREPELPPFAGPATGAHLAECALPAVEERVRAIRDRLLQDRPGDEVLVVAGLRATVAGINRAEMARRQSQGAEGIRLGPLCPWISVGDPVIMCRNHYKFGLMNGETGIVASLEPVEIAWGSGGRSTPVKDEYRADIQPAWAITAHRSQGSEAARVVVALDSKAMLTRQWLYTAITRATKQSILVGPRALLRTAVSRASQRVTGFSLMTGRTSWDM